jgi:cytosine/adenosine deaminase-related metal-dependent hydrolase
VTEPTRSSVDLLIAGGFVVTVDRERRIFKDGAIAVRGSEIVEVGQSQELRTKYAAVKTIELQDKVVTPGLINAHRHLLCTAKGAQPDGNITLKNLETFVYPSFAALSEEDMRVYTRYYTASMIRFGTTTFEEPGCVHLEATLEELATAGIRCRIGPWTWDHGGFAAGSLPDWLKMSTDQAVRRLYEGLDTVRRFGHPRILDAVTIEGVGTCSDALNKEAAELAKSENSLFVLHKATSEREVEMELALYGHRPVEHMYETGAMNEHVLMNHVTSLELFEVDLFAATGARISQNPSSALKLSKGTTQTGKWSELLAAGVPIGLGTDAENASNHDDICRSMYLAALLPRDARRDPQAVTAEAALEMATIGGAQALRMEDQIGSLEAGKQADITIFDATDFDWWPLHNPISNLVYGATGYSADTVIVGGRIVLEHKEHTQVDMDAARAAVEAADRRVLGEIGITPLPRWPVL